MKVNVVKDKKYQLGLSSRRLALENVGHDKEIIFTVLSNISIELQYIRNKMETKKVKVFNIFILGLVFMLIFTGFNTMTGIQVKEIVQISHPFTNI